MKRGRPPKFGRPARLMALTLPDDVVAWLQQINSDPAWAIVSLFDRDHPRRASTASARKEGIQDVELAGIGARRALIVVPQAAFGGLHGVSIVPLSAGRAFLALEPGKGMADLELAVVDRLDQDDMPESERRALTSLRQHLRAWRQDKTLTFTARSIIVVERARRSGTSAKRTPRAR